MKMNKEEIEKEKKINVLYWILFFLLSWIFMGTLSFVIREVSKW